VKAKALRKRRARPYNGDPWRRLTSVHAFQGVAHVGPDDNLRHGLAQDARNGRLCCSGALFARSGFGFLRLLVRDEETLSPRQKERPRADMALQNGRCRNEAPVHWPNNCSRWRRVVHDAKLVRVMPRMKTGAVVHVAMLLAACQSAAAPDTRGNAVAADVIPAPQTGDASGHEASQGPQAEDAGGLVRRSQVTDAAAHDAAPKAKTLGAACYCMSWVHQAENGEDCYRTLAECNKRFAAYGGNKIPCRAAPSSACR
jgi:hypothetical protein